MLRERIARYRWIILFWVVFALFWGVTVYFYFQHRVVVYSYPVNMAADLGDLHVLVKGATLENFGFNFDMFLSPWTVWTINHAPERLRQPLMEALAFYRRPYVFYPDKGVLSVRGWIAGTAPGFDRMDHAERENMVAVDVRNYHRHSWGASSYSVSNIFCFKTESYAPLQLRGFDITITDRRTGQVAVIPVTANRERTVYTFGNSQSNNPDFGTKEIMLQFINLIRQNRLDAAAAYVLPERRQSFPWPGPAHGYWKLAGDSYFPWYEGRYQGYDNVYSYSIDSTDDPDAGMPITRQKIYFIDKDGRWQIIDAAPGAAPQAPPGS